MKKTYQIRLNDNLFECSEETDIMRTICKKKIGSNYYGCCGGGCGICKAAVISGQYQVVSRMSREHISAAEEAAGVVLLCCIQPRSNLIISQRRKNNGY